MSESTNFPAYVNVIDTCFTSEKLKPKNKQPYKIRGLLMNEERKTSKQSPAILITATDYGLEKLAKNSISAIENKGINKYLASTRITSTFFSPFGITVAAISAAMVFLDRINRNEKRKYNEENLIKGLQKILDLPVTPVIEDPEKAKEKYSFREGHIPNDGAVYVAHPALPESYILPERFEIVLAKEKTAVFRQLIGSLGAKKVKILSASTNEKKGFFGGNASIKKAASDVGIRASFDSKGEVQNEETASFGKPDKEPHVPESIYEWVYWDPELRTLSQHRLEQNLLSTRVTMSYDNLTSVYGAASLAFLGASNTGDIKSGYSGVTQSTWTYEVDFWDKDELSQSEVNDKNSE